MKVHFEKPLHRWLVFTISEDENSIELDAVAVSQNFLIDLLAMLTRVWNGETSICLVFLNPKHIHLQWLNNSNFRVASSEYLDNAPCYTDNETLAEFDITAKELCIAFWRGLRDLESKTTPEEYQKHWGGEFPSESLQILTNLIKQDKDIS